ncbi:hypothetical protein GA0070624_0461 [Micromonospora rhizosphaerae]|uniref:HpcH/HpaI aldolase/citrate lyase family protein n=1 Tax=Micromonospora rhizosphaerae TaxID=568872 RepID=A0A1C6RBP8_9ACTN|nr:hypothetical protein [Micromonospora rhizosphaerae]SCL14563.1 hypothetical protein GA0070624_0461 [Micromonospora rhizosphaerae]
MSTQLPRLLAGLVDDAAVFPPGSASVPDAVVAHRRHRTAWYADLVGPLLLPASTLPELAGLLDADERIAVGVIADVPIGQLHEVRAGADPRITVRQVESAVAKRGEDPQPGLADLIKLTERLDGVHVHAEVPLTFGLMAALDTLAEARAGGLPIAAKFRTGGLAAELFPTPVELAAVICACRDRELPFKLTAGLHHAVRHRDPETGFTHHGFGNVLAAALAAVEGAEVDAVAELLAVTDPVRLVERARARRDSERPLWIGYGSCSIEEPLTDLIRLGLVNGGFEE